MERCRPVAQSSTAWWRVPRTSGEETAESHLAAERRLLEEEEGLGLIRRRQLRSSQESPEAVAVAWHAQRRLHRTWTPRRHAPSVSRSLWWGAIGTER